MNPPPTKVPALLAVGWEGVFGMCFMSFFSFFMYFASGPSSRGGRFEDANDAILQVRRLEHSAPHSKPPC